MTTLVLWTTQATSVKSCTQTL